MKKLKLMALIMVAIMTFSLAGCSDSSYGGGNNFQGGNSFIDNGGNNLQGGNGFINSGSNNTNSDSGTTNTVKPTKSVKAGMYTFYNKESGRYLSASGNALVLSTTPYDWKISLKEADKFYVYAGKSDLLFDIHNAYVAKGTTIKLWTNTGYDVQLWNIYENQNGSYSFICSKNNNYCLGFKNGNAVLQIRDEINAMQEWELVETTAKYYKKIVGTKGIIELQLPTDINRVITDSRLQKWADDLETAYATFKELTSYQPYEMVIVEAYKPCKYIGYVVEDSNIIHIDNKFIYDDLEKMSKRNNDWNFCALHEMGHMFDNHRPWNFETEMMTDLKLVYVLETNGAAAAPAEYDATKNFVGKNIIKAYEGLKSDFSKNYNIYGCAYRFIQIKEDIGWQPFKQTFHKMQSEYAQYSNYTKQQKLDSFISLLSSYSGKNIKSYFNANEWSTIVKKVNS